MLTAAILTSLLHYYEDRADQPPELPPAPSPVGQLGPYREDYFGPQQSREMELEAEVSKLRTELAYAREHSSEMYKLYMDVTGRRMSLNGRYLDITNRSGQLLERHPIPDLKKGTDSTGPR